MPALLTMLFGGFVAQMSKLAAFTVFLIAVVFVFFSTLWIFGSDLFYYLMGLMFDFISYLLTSLNLDPKMFDFMSTFRQLPVSILEVAQYVGFTTCIKILLSALVIRITINLIPFLKV